MHILMIAPEPFFEPRGTPFSEFHRVRALTTLGHTVDLVTYPFGRDVELPGLRIIRCVRPPFLRRIGIGPSWAKVPLDGSLALSAFRAAWRSRYDAVHSHEEAGVIGVLIARWLGVPHLYDMHSSLPQQVTNFDYRGGGWLARVLAWSERLMIRRSRVVIVICPDLELTVREVDADVPVVLIENAPGSGRTPEAGSGRSIRAQLGLSDAMPVLLYTGTFEAYQGLDLLLAAFAIVHQARPDARLVLVGGEPRQVEQAKARAGALGIGAGVLFTGQRPPEEVPAYLDAATLLVSPRSTGTNTPLKIYQYLRSGRPIVATNLRTHTQVLSAETAFLAAPTPEGLAATVMAALDDPARAEAVGAAARQLADTRYTDEAFIAKIERACSFLASRTANAAPEGAS
jgi:glycosyltransferase involved in cell wall biosynthesis